MAERTAQEAIDAAGEHADPAWVGAARQVVRRLAHEGEEFTTDDVWRLLAERGLVTHEPRALGSIIQAASRAKVIRPVGYRPSTRPECHGRPVRTWVGHLIGEPRRRGLPYGFTAYFDVADELDGGLSLDELSSEFVAEAREAAAIAGLPWPPDLATAEEFKLAAAMGRRS